MRHQLPLCFTLVISYVKATFGGTVPVFVLNCYRAAWPVVTESLPTGKIFRPVNGFVGGGFSRNEKVF
jgi:hypothetical protein